MGDRTEEQELYRSIEDEIQERDTIELDEEKGAFRTWFEDSKEKVNEKVGDGGSAVRYIGTGFGMGYLLERLSPIPIRLPKMAVPILGAVVGGLAWYENKDDIKNKRELRKEVRRQARELEDEL